VRKHLSRHRDLGEPERDVETVLTTLRADLISFSRRQVSVHGAARGQRQRPHEIAKVIREDVELEADGR
jgi:hypothetical protein